MLGGIWGQLAALGGLVVIVFGYLFNRDRKVRKKTREADAAAGTAAREEVETEHADDTINERLERLRKAEERNHD